METHANKFDVAVKLFLMVCDARKATIVTPVLLSSSGADGVEGFFGEELVAR